MESVSKIYVYDKYRNSKVRKDAAAKCKMNKDVECNCFHAIYPAKLPTGSKLLGSEKTLTYVAAALPFARDFFLGGASWLKCSDMAACTSCQASREEVVAQPWFLLLGALPSASVPP